MKDFYTYHSELFFSRCGLTQAESGLAHALFRIYKSFIYYFLAVETY